MLIEQIIKFELRKSGLPCSLGNFHYQHLLCKSCGESLFTAENILEDNVYTVPCFRLSGPSLL